MSAIDQALGQYEIGTIISIKRAGGTANVNFIISAEAGVFFLRLRNPKYSNTHHLTDDHDLIQFLRGKKFPAPTLLRTKKGKTFVKSDIGAYELSEFVEAGPFDGGGGQLAEAARSLGRLHECARAWKPAHPKATLPARYDRPGDFLPRWVELLKDARRTDDLEYITHQGKLAEDMVDDDTYDGLSDWTIHGDYTPANMLFRGGRLAGLFDFDWAGRHPRLRDIADMLIHFCADRETPIQSGDIESLTQSFVFDTTKIQLALDGYREAMPLAADEIKLLPAFIRRRWIYSRAAATFKVPPEKRLDVLTRNFKEPLLWLDRNEAAVFGKAETG